MKVLDTVFTLFGCSRTLLRLDDTPAPGSAETAVMPLIADLRRSVSPEVRSETTEVYLECVITRNRLEACMEILLRVLGPAAKPFDEKVAFEKTLRAMVDSRGGILKDQCLYLRRYEDDHVAFAALWPWADPESITLKVGVYDEKC